MNSRVKHAIAMLLALIPGIFDCMAIVLIECVPFFTGIGPGADPLWGP